MPLVLIRKDFVLEGSTTKIEDKSGFVKGFFASPAKHRIQQPNGSLEVMPRRWKSKWWCHIFEGPDVEKNESKLIKIMTLLGTNC